MRALVVVALLASTAAAESTLQLRVEGDDLVASVVGIPKVEPLSIYDPYADGDERAYIDARSVRAFFDDPVAVALVFSGEDHVRVGEAVDRLGLEKTLVTGSEGLVVTFADDPIVALPWSPVLQLSGKSVSSMTKTGTRLAAAVTLAYEQLATRTQPRKLIILVANGDDAEEGAAVHKLSELRASNPDVIVVALQPSTSISEWNVLESLTWDVIPANGDDLDAAFAQALHIAGARFEARFELAKLPRDGKDHTFLLVHEHEQLATATIEMPKPPPPPPPSKTWRWLVLAGVVAAFCLVSFVMFRTK